MVTINKRTLTMLCASLALSACSTANISQSAIPEQGLTVSQLYQQSLQQPVQKAVVQQVRFEDSGEEFKQLPNPEVPIHIFAHVAQLGDEQIIKPAYTTRFFLYKQNQYALASELY
ncbi:TPA: TIGR03751 family conjugal transfer lipoprotein [Legionella pneumophila subsp. pneumophila]|uniref:TIGR03751 family conjugal transfer lipoprotein n=1 Tax=Legionella sp. PATHC039 TaxID=2992042 RepID=UPI001A1B1877|nr:TIGR03751 family conjugal transfer lipoprotein [Legionella sp. PATHC039]MCW8394136.1 TIGR03751 family conjugal transfer lipoprotein [Legionella sp. PATHC039]HAT8857650.1 TIGR03751 family conjugal transfer lipoprotein [Legionella pneumophila subsp. pneumophila]HAT9651954.1 TIGR03751 family conjugal transfer lipoprotein [Legionella pneumophila subsp. pneumophila]HAT9919213.1 TIGR03751 family conjugal transfer lipoprotein [Legionella pneumophila subsp. pneumophila]